MTQHLVSFTDHQSVSLEGGPAQDFFFLSVPPPLLEAVADNSSPSPRSCIQPTLFGHLVAAHV